MATIARIRRAGGDQGGHHGSASVEFALVLPLVLILGLATLQVALLTKDQLVVQGAARAGAREAAVSTDDAMPGPPRSTPLQAWTRPASTSSWSARAERIDRSW